MAFQASPHHLSDIADIYVAPIGTIGSVSIAPEFMEFASGLNKDLVLEGVTFRYVPVSFHSCLESIFLFLTIEKPRLFIMILMLCLFLWFNIFSTWFYYFIAFFDKHP
jgi:ABC-type multidrug transport system permease subunit